MSTHSVIDDIRRRARDEASAAPAEPAPPSTPEEALRSAPSAERPSPAPPSPEPPSPEPEVATATTAKSRTAGKSARRPRNRFRRGPVIRAAVYSVALVAIALVADHFLLTATGSAWTRTLAAAISFGAAAALIFSVALRAAWRAGAGRGHVPIRERLIRDALDSDGQPRAVFDPESRLIHANNAFTQLFRRHRAEGMDAIRTALDGNRTGLQELDRICDLAVSGIRAQAEFELRDPTGVSEWRRIEAVPIEGHPGHFVIWADEPPPDSNLIEQLRAEQRTFADFLENAPIGFYSVDESGRFVYMNETLANWLGVTPRDLTDGKVYLPNHVVADGAPMGVPYDPFGGKTGAGEGEAVMRDMRGRQFPVQIIQRVETGPAGLRTRSIVRDLTPERLWQRTLQQTKAKIESLLADSPVGVAVLDFEGHIREINSALRTMLGAEGPEFEGAAFVDLIANDGQEDFRQRFEQVLQGQVSGIALEVRARLQQGSILSIYLSRFGTDQDEDAGVFVHCLDLSEQRQLEMQIAHSQKMQAIGQLAGGVAHDFNNLLTAMIGYCDLLLMRHRPGEQSFADITQIKQNANRAADLVRQLLAFSRQQTLKPKVLSITDVLTDLSHLLRRLVGTNIQFKLTHGRDLGRVRVDQGQFEQVIVNLVVNARDAMPDGGVVEIRTNNVRIPKEVRYGAETLPAGSYILLEVIDQGTGIERDHVNRIFDPFFSTKRQGEGTGLGLSTVYGIVKQTGGHVFVESEVGAGTKFSIFLPAYEPQAGEEPAETSLARGGMENLGRDLTGAGMVMLVEDEEAVRQFSARALRNKGYQVVEESTGQTAFNTLKGGRGPEIDVLVTDIMMPDMDGTALINEVQQRWPHIKIICISGYAEDAFREKIDQSEDVYFLPKPFNLSQLAGLVKDVMTTRAA